MPNIPDSTYRGTITRISGTSIFVTVPKLGMGVEYGPCQRAKMRNDNTVDPHYKQGQQVLLSTVNGVPEDLVVLCVLE